MKQEEMLKKIQKTAEDIPAPSSLEPEQMMKRLQEEERKNRFSPIRYGAAAAALLAVVLLAGIPGIVKPENQRAGSGTEITQGKGMGQTNQAAPGEPEQQLEAGGNEEKGSEEPDEENGNYLASSYEQIYDLIQKQAGEWDRGGGADVIKYEMAVEDGISQSPLAGMLPRPGGTPELQSGETTGTEGGVFETEAGYSGTNVQVMGVDEGDVVKTDGTYLYVMSGQTGTVQIIKANGAKIEKAGLIPDTSTVSGAKSIEEFYVDGNRLSVIRRDYGSGSTVVETYDIKDPADPKLLGSVSQDGSYMTSRRNGTYIYLFTRYSADFRAKKQEIERYVPKVDGKVIPLNYIYIPEEHPGIEYLVVSAVDMRDPGQAVQSKAVYSGGEYFYVSQENIYIGNGAYDYKADQYDYTELLKFEYKDGRVRFRAHGNVDGFINDQFAMDEYQGNLRVVTTLSHQSGKTTNSLQILDQKLKKIGEVEDLAPGEQIYSARFMGDTAYFVTFRNMDPLFSADLSDPRKPKILGELKITGFSEYLHPFGEGLLLGIGKEIHPESGNFKGLKLSMFNTEDPSDVREHDKTVEPSYEYTPAWDQHRAVLVSVKENIIGFAVNRYNKEKRTWSNQYVVYSYENGEGFIKQLEFDLEENGNADLARGVFIGEWLYVTEENRVTSFDLAHFKRFGDVKF